MHLDVLELREFYYRTPLGSVARQAVGAQLSAFWGDMTGQCVVGFGFAVPVLRPALATARRVLALMPAEQGVMAWPAEGESRAVLCGERHWPLPDGFVDRLLVMHGLETSENAAALLDEAARVLAPEGRALFVVPNRAGLWARRDVTPFGFGRPYTPGQLDAQLSRHGFEPESHRVALFAPPSERPFWLRMAPTMERIGRRVPNRYAGGVLMVEARKHVRRPSGSGLEEMVRRPLRVLEGLSGTGEKPAGAGL
mgnify:CR=1 FL=1